MSDAHRPPQADGNPAAAEGDTPKRRGRRWLRWLAGAGALVVVLVLAVPFVVSAGFVRARIERELTAAAGSPVRIANHGFGWFSGVRLQGVTIANPPGFDGTRPAIELEDYSGHVGLLGLARGRYDLSGVATGLRVRIQQRGDGSTNLAALFPAAESPADPQRPDGHSNPDSGAAAPFPPHSLRVQVRITDSEISFSTVADGEVESLRGLTIAVAKEFADARATIQVDGTTGSQGSLKATAHVALDGSGASDATLALKDLDLGRYRGWLNRTLGPEGGLASCAGVLGGTLHLEASPGGAADLRGDLTVQKPDFSGPAVGGLKLAEPLWTLRPRVRLGAIDDLRTVSLEGFEVDLGFLQVRGLAADKAQAAAGRRATGVTVQADLPKVAALGVPALREFGSGEVGGVVTLATDWAKARPPADFGARWSEWVGARLDLSLDRYRVAGLDLEKAKGTLVLRDGVAEFVTAPGAALSQGPLTLKLNAPLARLHSAGSTVTLQWTGGQVAGEAVQALQYVVPFFAGLARLPAASLDFRGLASAQITLGGPALPREGEAIGTWLNRWTGQGTVALADGQFTPAPAWSAALQFAGAKTPIAFKSIDSKFRFRQGAVETELARLSERAARWSLTGTTSLDGRIDYSLDLRGLLAGHRDGARVLNYLGAAPIAAKIGGSLLEPRLQAPPFGDLLTKALRGAAEEAARGAIERGLRDLFKKKR